MNHTVNRVILHCDMNGFYASVELLDYPQLRDKPMAVCGDPESRHGIILAKTRLQTIRHRHSGDPVAGAKKCRSCRPSRPITRKYQHYSRLINDIYLQYTDMVEPFSVDESSWT